MNTHADKAKQNFLNGYNCAQSVLLAFSDVTGLDDATAFKISSSFGGGMGRMREVCGAVSGMLMIAGLVNSKGNLTDNPDKIEHYKLVQSLAKGFKDKHGTIICRELLKDLNVDSTPNAEPRTKEYYQKRSCSEFVYDCAKLMDDYLMTL